MTRSEKALENFMAGYNCAQSITLAFADLLPVDEKTISTLACSFGGGVGRLREVCGAFSGAVMVLGLLYGYDGPETGDVKLAQYERVQTLGKRMEEKWGTIVCRELLDVVGHDDPKPSERNAEYYATRPCARIVENVAALLEEYLTELAEKDRA